MIRKCIIGLCLLAAAGVSAQNTLIPSVSNYHLTWTTLNPAFSGFRDAISASTLYRSGLYGGVGPQDMQLNVHTPVGNSKVALGGVVAYNDAPPDQGLYAFMTTYAYRLYLVQGLDYVSYHLARDTVTAGQLLHRQEQKAVLVQVPDDQLSQRVQGDWQQ